MTIYDELVQYSQDCINDVISSCKKHKWACERFLNDINRIGNKDFPYIWNEKEAQKIVDWFALLYHCKGVLAGKPIILETCQKFSICQIFGWRHKETGYKRFTNYFKEEARKNGKSQEEAGIVLYLMSVESIEMGEIYECYCAGTKREQSNLIFKECKNMLRRSPLLRKFKLNKTEILHNKSMSFIKPLSKEDGKTGDGTNPAVLILDEYHQHPDTSFYDLGIGGNTKQSILMIITTAGKSLNCPCYTQEYKLASNILNPEINITNDKYFVDIFEADEGDDLGDLITWQKANPIRAYYKKGLEVIQQNYDIAKIIPEKMISFKTKILNIWVQHQDAKYMDMGKWKACQCDFPPIDLDGQPVYIGFDLSCKTDLTSISFVIPYLEINIPHYLIYSHSFVPSRAKLEEHEIRDKAPYISWADRNFITVTDTPVVDQDMVIDYMENFCNLHNLKIQMLCLDPYNASKMQMDLSKKGYVCVEIYQSMRSLNEATKNFRDEVYKANVKHVENPVLNYAVYNAVVVERDGLIKIDKSANEQRIDPVDATLCAFKMAQYHEFEYDSEATDKWLDNDEW